MYNRILILGACAYIKEAFAKVDISVGSANNLAHARTLFVDRPGGVSGIPAQHE